MLLEDYTGHPEILDGRVKTLHPKVHGGILARRDIEHDMHQLLENQINVIDMVVVNLYPFAEMRAKAEQGLLAEGDSLIEYIDIGGPTLLRAAAKNFDHVASVSDPKDYKEIIDSLSTKANLSLALRKKLAAKVFARIAAYDASIAQYLHEETAQAEDGKLLKVETFVLEQVLPLRYGENPHQQAALFRPAGQSCAGGAGEGLWRQLQGKELSYNNILDFHAALDLFLELKNLNHKAAAAVVVKHSNPCGVALKPTALEAFRMARACDPVSAFGGIIVVDGEVDEALALALTEEFSEVILAESLSEAAKQTFQTKKNLRVLEVNFRAYLSKKQAGQLMLRNFYDDFLIQTADNELHVPNFDEPVSGAVPSPTERRDLILAWAVCKHVKSNAIVIVKDGQAIGIGAGQMSRVDAARIALDRAQLHGHDVKGAVAASDAFLPFADTLELLNDAGVKALIQPGGSIKDKDVIAEAVSRGVQMFFTGVRHFRH